MSEEASHLLRTRREKLAALRERGIEPYPYRFSKSHQSDEAIAAFSEAERSGSVSEGTDGSEVRLAGRIVSWRGHGKTAFAHVQDGAGRIQVYFRIDVLGEEHFSDLGLLDLGDWIGVEGGLFRTKTGEVTVRV
ncbi:MAG: lysine--tRNA ligase, partial [Gemmatimonadetes bacterium]|nr:lysine--tRNA ligase [Gemmatimonadota bacterium]